MQAALVCIPRQGNQHLPHRDHEEDGVEHNEEDDGDDKDHDCINPHLPGCAFIICGLTSGWMDGRGGEYN